MSILLGPFDLLKLDFGLINHFMKKGLLSYEEARAILKNSLDQKMSDSEKEKFLDSIIKRDNA